MLAGCGGSGADKAGGAQRDGAVALTLATRDADEWEARFAREVARLSHGTMRIDVRGDQHRDEDDWEQRTVEDVRAGKFDLGDTGARVWDLSADFAVCPGMVCTLISETRWSAYRDRLTLTPIPGRPFSSVGVAAPWTRAG